MNEPDTPFDYLNVTPPKKPSGSLQSQEVTAQRLARHVAVLFGVDVPQNPTGRTWVADYERLSVKDIAQGALTKTLSAEEKDKLDRIATATVQKYGPDSKAALILTGCEVLFSSVEEVFSDVIGILKYAEDVKHVANTTILAVWSLLVADLFRAQPALAAAAMKARAIQSEAYLGWVMSNDDDDKKVNLATAERPNELNFDKDSDTFPRHLSILDSTISRRRSSPEDALSYDLVLTNPNYGKNANNRFLLLSLIDSRCRYILRSSDRAVAWITADVHKPELHRADAYLPQLEPTIAFVATVLSISPYIQPLYDDTFVPFTRSTIGSDGQHTNAKLTERLLPHKYSAVDISKLPPRSRRALLMTHMNLLRVYRESDDFRSDYLNENCREDAKGIVGHAEFFFGKSDPMTTMLRMAAAAMEIGDFRDVPDGAGISEHYETIIQGYEEIFTARSGGMVPEGRWIALVNDYSAELRQAIAHIHKSDPQRSEALKADHHKYWNSVIQESGLSGLWKRAWEGDDKELTSNGMNVLYHNYLALQFQSEDEQTVRKAIRFSVDELIPERKRVSESRGSETPYRRTVQITVRPVHNHLKRKDLDPAWRLELIQDAHDLAEELEHSDLARELLPDRFSFSLPMLTRDFNQSDLAFLGSLLRAQISVLENWQLTKLSPIDLAERTIRTLHVATRVLANMIALESAQLDNGNLPTSAPRKQDFDEYLQRICDAVTTYEIAISDSYQGVLSILQDGIQ